MKRVCLARYRLTVVYEYLDTNIYYVTQCISIRRHGYHALTVLLIINRLRCFY